MKTTYKKSQPNIITYRSNEYFNNSFREEKKYVRGVKSM